MENKSLDARHKPKVAWQVRVGVSSPEIREGEPPEQKTLEIPFKKRLFPVAVVGSGPAGFFAALVLQKAGFQVTLIERGSEVKIRSRAVLHFERTGIFDPKNNYAFGEGGAGTFSDGKLISRSKRISREKQFIISNYIKAGAPEEIAYLAHPHLGTDNLPGLESKTSLPVQVLRQPNGRCEGFETLYIVGEGSGYAGGIVSSAADGIKAAMGFAEANK